MAIFNVIWGQTCLLGTEKTVLQILRITAGVFVTTLPSAVERHFFRKSVISFPKKSSIMAKKWDWGHQKNIKKRRGYTQKESASP